MPPLGVVRIMRPGNFVHGAPTTHSASDKNDLILHKDEEVLLKHIMKHQTGLKKLGNFEGMESVRTNKNSTVMIPPIHVRTESHMFFIPGGDEFRNPRNLTAYFININTNPSHWWSQYSGDVPSLTKNRIPTKLNSHTSPALPWVSRVLLATHPHHIALSPGSSSSIVAD